jgi:hypothetical protein
VTEVKVLIQCTVTGAANNIGRLLLEAN